MQKLAEAYPNDVRLVFKHLVVHPQIARTPALASCAAQKQGRFWEMEHAIWESAWGPPEAARLNRDNLGEDNMMKLAQSLSLDIDRFKADMNGNACRDEVDGTSRLLGPIGADGTPTFYINGHIIQGALPFEQLKARVEEELKKADDAIKSGQIKPQDFYQKMVVERGKKSIGS
jgi:protein-disulfide isomerase